MRLPVEGSWDARRLAKGNKRIPIQTIALRTLYAAGAISTALVAPRMLKLFPAVSRGKDRRQELYARIDQALYRLRAKKLIYFSNTKGRRPIAHLTKRGGKEMKKIILEQYLISETVIWDGKWRMVIFDIRERRRRVRQQLRILLKSAGMMRLQDSVWVYPYPCDEFVVLIRAHLSIGVGELRSVVVDALEADRAIRDHFNLA